MNTARQSLPRVLLVDMMSGSNDYGRELVTGLAPLCELTVVTVDNSPVATMQDVRCLAVFPEFGGKAPKLQKLRQTISAFITLTRELWRHRKGTVHVQFFRFQLLDMLLYAAMLPWLRCLVYTAHNALPHEAQAWHKRVYKAWYRHVTQVQVLSTYARDRVIEFAGLPSAKVHVVPHGNYASLLERSTDAPTPTLQDYGVPAGHKVALFFGLMRQYKGVDILIEAAAHIPVHTPLTIVVAGAGDREVFDQYAELAKKLGVTSRFVFKNDFLTDDELAGLLRLSDFTVFPYRHIYQSGALMLAMTFGKAMVASDLAGFREYVEGNVQALLFDTGDAVSLGQTLVRITDDAELCSRLGKQAALTASTKFGWNSIAQQLVRIYQNNHA